MKKRLFVGIILVFSMSMLFSKPDFQNSFKDEMKTGVLVSNILAGMEYGVKFRIMWNVLIGEADLNLLPMEGAA